MAAPRANACKQQSASSLCRRCGGDHSPHNTPHQACSCALPSESLSACRSMLVLSLMLSAGTLRWTSLSACALPTTHSVVQARLLLCIPVEQLGAAFGVLDKAQAQRQFEQYSSEGSLQLTVEIDEERAEWLASQMEDATAGAVVPEQLPDKA